VQTGQSYRLPTEAEWEYAARAGSQGDSYWDFFWDKQEGSDAACRFADVGDMTAKERRKFESKRCYDRGRCVIYHWDLVGCRDGFAETAPVREFQDNAWGLKDMIGNVMEWTCSVYQDQYRGTEKRCAGRTSANILIAVRGGSWHSEKNGLRLSRRFGAWRHLVKAENLGNKLGVRLVRILLVDE
jgi:formylglycine-generating enzyme required for sulfatase activity